MRKILGLDLGTNSIGWAVLNSIDDEQNKKMSIEMSGSRIIPMDAATLGDFDKGVTKSQTSERTALRGIRRLRERDFLRRERLHKVLKVLFISASISNPIVQALELSSNNKAQKVWTSEMMKEVCFLLRSIRLEM